ncbi:hypothetical protein J1C56_22170 [Aminobacter anthyllidis]|uniref:Uncharacterized protein n=1 Tax=Aminobacter anthyllidis TaxID=1035067 RepID=A0A9X1D5X9_9HYPH|nr:hypothetical protein [Aminobacter anthyllidis]MBT1158310.1 hypothetical protein [Aminobacter anthyllidis]
MKPTEKPWQHPVFRIPMMEREAGCTDAQWACVMRDQERHAEAKGIYLGLFQLLCSHLGHFRTCSRGACRRLGKCVGRRAEDDWSFAFRPLIPPCVPLEEEIVEAMRAEIRAEVNRLVVLGEARGDA